jgi:Fe-S cluster assembly protein SufD
VNANPSTTLDPLVHYLAVFEAGQRARTGASAGWLSSLREEAASRFSRLGFPKPKDEEWRATSLAPLLSVAFAPAPRPTLAQARAAFEAVRLGPAAGERLVFVDGSFAEELSTARDLGGAVAQSLAAAVGRPPGALEDLLGRASPERGFTALNTALFTDGAFIHLPRGALLEEPIELVFLATGRREAVFVQPRNLIIAEPGSRARIVERYLCAGEGPYFTNVVTQIAAGDGAVLEHYRLQREAELAFHVSEVEVRQGRDAQVTAHSYNTGTTLVRNDVAVSLAAPGARIALFGLSVTEGTQHVDNHTCIEHLSPHCASEEAYRAILDGASKSVFHGRIVVYEGAQKTDATQSNRSLLLSEDATVNTKPQLEIHADDVKCTHGAAVGQLDKEALFYLRSRGLGEKEAHSMLTRAFASQVIDRVKLDWLRKVIEEQLLAGLGALQGAKA